MKQEQGTKKDCKMLNKKINAIWCHQLKNTLISDEVIQTSANSLAVKDYKVCSAHTNAEKFAYGKNIS